MRPDKPSDIRVVTVAKVLGGEWFDRMGVGIEELARDLSIDASFVGADDIDPLKQVRIVEKLVDEGPTAITVIPNDPTSLEATFQRARQAGVVVVTHESSDQINADADIEAFDNLKYGAAMMSSLAQAMHGSGEYVTFLGQAGAQSHVDWLMGAEAAALDYPDLKRAAGPIETFEKATVAYQRTMELLARNPGIRGFLGTGSTDVVGIGRAIRENGLQHRTSVVGTSIPSMAGSYLTDGSVDKIFFWDPALAGKAQVLLALKIAAGESIATGTSLPIPGYEFLHRVAGQSATFHGTSWIEADATNFEQYAF